MLIKKIPQFLLVSIVVSFSSFVIAEDLINNESFEYHGQLNHDQSSCGIFSSLPFWQFDDQSTVFHQFKYIRNTNKYFWSNFSK